MQDRISRWWATISLRTKITGVTVLLLTLGLAVAGSGTLSVVSSYLITQVDADLGRPDRRWTVFAQQARDAGFWSAAAVPMRIRGEVVGALSVRLEFDHYTVTLGPTPIPAPLMGLDATFHGPENARESADVSWAVPADGQVLAFAVLERGTPLDPFTECVADGSALSFTIERDVLEPFLRIGAFQANVVDHAHVAAANTPVGCIEIRYAHRHSFNP